MESENHNTISNFDQNSEAQPTTAQQDSNSLQEGPGSLEEVRQRLTSTADELETLRDKYLRLAAEFENYKRRVQRDQSEAIRFANEGLLKELLPIVDNLERAIRSAKECPTLDGVAEGVDLTLKQFLETLARFGVRPVSSIGEQFDPSRHQAVSHTGTDAPENTVVEEYLRGYLLHDRVLRAAMVSVAGPKSSGERHDDHQGNSGRSDTGATR
jgi:molecular chaperone GrpE